MESTSKAWTELMTPFSQFWLESSGQAWKNWFDLMGKGMAGGGENKAGAEFGQLPPQFAQSQQFYNQLLKLSFDNWQKLWPQVGEGKVGPEAVQSYLEQIQQQIQSYVASGQVLQEDLEELRQAYLKEAQKFTQLWLSTWQSSVTPLGQLPQGTIQPWLELSQLYGDALYGQTFGSWARSPMFGPSRQLNSKVLQTFDDWVKLCQAMGQYQALEADIQYRGMAALTEKLLEQAHQGQPTKTWKEFQQLWAVTADQVFEEAFCDEANLKVRGNFINALNRYRLQQQGIFEELCKTFNLPTRSEVDELHQTVYQLKKEVKALKKKLAQAPVADH